MGLLTNLALFAGAGGLELGARKCGGFRTVGYVERDRYAQGVLMSRIREGDLDDAPIWDDVTTFDGRPYRGLVDCVSGGFPCQDLSFAGKRAGIVEGKRSGLWKEYARIVGEVHPRFVLVENVPGLLADGALGVVLGDLAGLGFDAEWWRLSAADVAAPHLRQRIFIVAYRKSESPRPDADVFRWDQPEVDERGRGERGTELRDEQERQLGSVGCTMADSQDTLRRPIGQGIPSSEKQIRREKKAGRIQEGVRNAIANGSSESGANVPNPDRPGIEGIGRTEPDRGAESLRNNQKRGAWSIEPNVGRVAHGVAFRVDRLRLCGNGVVPDQSVPAWALIKKIAASVA